MRITVVGPATPWRGGLPLLVSGLAHRLAAAGHAVTVQTWTDQGPARLLPTKRLTAPEAAAFPTQPAALSWRNPVHGWRVGRRASASDLVIVVHYATLQAPVLWAVARAAGRPTCGSSPCSAAASIRRPRVAGARVVAICANAVPHEPRRGDRLLTRLLLGAVDGAVVHTAAERAALAGLTARPVAVAALPPHLPDGPPVPRPSGVRRRLLFFGKIRRYKGLDVLLRALTQVDDVALTVVGEVYPDAGDVAALVDGLGLRDRVTLHPGYLPAPQIPELFASVDALVLPYRSATASQHVALAHRHGVPVVATRVGNFPDVIDGGGLLCAPDDVADLVRALRALYAPGRLAALSAAIPISDDEQVWTAYLAALLVGTPGTRDIASSGGHR